jgi:cyanate permease
MAMSVGYLLASFGPVAIGRLRDVTGSFELPIAVLATLVLIFTLPALGLPAAGQTDAPD